MHNLSVHFALVCGSGSWFRPQKVPWFRPRVCLGSGGSFVKIRFRNGSFGHILSSNMVPAVYGTLVPDNYSHGSDGAGGSDGSASWVF